MKFNFNREKLSNVLHDFYNVTGINITILDENFVSFGVHTNQINEFCKYVQKNGDHNCRCSDIELLNRCKKSGKIETKVCHAGLTDICVPITYNSEIICYLLYGQIKNNDTKTFDDPELDRLYRERKIHSGKEIKSIISISQMLARYILLENMVTPLKSSLADAIDSYIEQNIDHRITIEEIAAGVGCSPSALYNNIRKFYGKTAGEYITGKQLEHAAHLLAQTDKSIEQISLETGFSSAQYFSKMFKKKYEISPLKYRKSKLK